MGSKAPPPVTLAGLLVRVRVIEAHDEIFNVEPFDRLADEIRDYIERVSTGRSRFIADPLLWKCG